MPWWSWVLIWTGLVVLLLAVLIVGALYLWRKLRAATAELERLSELESEFADLVAQRVPEYTPRRLALLRDRDEVRAERELAVEAADDRRSARRERKLARARALTHADPMQYAHLAELHPRKG